MAEFTAEDLKQFQSEPLYPDKYQRSMAKISEAFSVFDKRIVVSFSGGKDSSVLGDMTAQWCEIIHAPLHLAFVNTGLEYPELQRHVPEFKKYLQGKYRIDIDLQILQPTMRFDELISTYGYPLISKEVAEAIYYARRIRSRNGNVERERERANGKNCTAKEAGAYGMQSQWKRTELRGGRIPGLSRHQQRETEEQSSSDGCPEPG